MNRKTKRYAAGGEADETAKEKIVTKFGKTPGGEDTFERDREVKRGESGSESKAESTSAPKRASVTKEQLEKSGLSLRDYMNKERGLSRRGGEAPKAETKAEAPAPKESSGTGPKNTFLTKERSDAAQKSMSKGFDMGLFERGDLGIGNKKKESEAPAKIGNQSFAASKEGRGLTPYEKGKSIEELARMREKGNEATKKDREEKTVETRRRAAGKFQKTNEAVYGAKKGGSIRMASGGKTSSASSRGDGIAQRGKTKGRML